MYPGSVPYGSVELAGGILQQIVAGTGSVSVGGPSVTGAGVERFVGTSTILVGQPAEVGVGAERFTGTVVFQVGKPSVVSAGSLDFTGTGAVRGGGPSITGVGASDFAGAGTIHVGGPIISGTSTVTVPSVSGGGDPDRKHYHLIPSNERYLRELLVPQRITGVARVVSPRSSFNVRGQFTGIPEITGTGHVSSSNMFIVSVGTYGIPRSRKQLLDEDESLTFGWLQAA